MMGGVVLRLISLFGTREVRPSSAELVSRLMSTLLRFLDVLVSCAGLAFKSAVGASLVLMLLLGRKCKSAVALRGLSFGGCDSV